MTEFRNILLASHGTTGAQAAEKTAIQLSSRGGSIHHLIVVPEFWKGMMGDDWLNNGITRDVFANHLETQLGREIDEHIKRFSTDASQAGIKYIPAIMVGKPEECLLETSKQQDFDLVIMGSPRPRGMKGLRSRLKPEPLVQSLRARLLIVPYPVQ